MTRYDVCVIGGGPAGAAAALTLARYTKHSVCLIEASAYEEPRVGETVSGAIQALLGYLGADAILADSMAMDSFGSAAAWGGDALLRRDSIFTGHGQGLHLDRRLFDRALAHRLGAAGGVLRTSCPVRDVSRTGTPWRVAFDGADPIEASLIVDATGRQARIARRRGATRRKTDRLAGLAAHIALEPGTMPHTTVVESVPDGWWYMAPLPGGTAVLALMTDADLLRGHAITSAGDFRRHALATRHIGAALAKASWGGDAMPAPRVYPAESHGLDPVMGPGWIAAGDAASAFDPLSSLGIGHALGCGIQAARIADGLLRGDNTLADAYPGDIARHRTAYLAQAQAIYAAERRWPEAPFWKRRHARAV